MSGGTRPARRVRRRASIPGIEDGAGLGQHLDQGGVDEARYASGQLWVLDGGLSAQVQQMRV